MSQLDLGEKLKIKNVRKGEWADNKEEKWHDRLNRCKKSIYQTQQLFMIKMLNGLGIEGKVLTLIKGIYKKFTAKHHSYW